jgi:hypothetical protein
VDLNRIAREGSYVEVENGEIRYYCRSPLDGIRTLAAIKGKHEEESVLLYDGVHDKREGLDGEGEVLLQEVLSDPLVQRVMTILGARLVSVKPDSTKRPL